MKQSGGRFSPLWSDCNCEGMCLASEEGNPGIFEKGNVAYRQVSALVRSHWLKRQQDAIHLSSQREALKNNLRVPNYQAKVVLIRSLMMTKKLH